MIYISTILDSYFGMGINRIEVELDGIYNAALNRSLLL